MQLHQSAQIACRYKILYCASLHKHAYVKNAWGNGRQRNMMLGEANHVEEHVYMIDQWGFFP
jgi:hypothetical protein